MPEKQRILQAMINNENNTAEFDTAKNDVGQIEMPDGLTYWTADEVAECLAIGDDLYSKLWQILSDAKNPTPMGGDGSNGTVETPDGRYDPENDDKAPHWWSKLAPADQAIIRDAYRKESGE